MVNSTTQEKPMIKAMGWINVNIHKLPAVATIARTGMFLMFNGKRNFAFNSGRVTLTTIRAIFIIAIMNQFAKTAALTRTPIAAA